MVKSYFFITGSLAKGGAERQLFYLCKNLLNDNNHVELATLDQNEYYEIELKKLGLKVHYFDHNLKIKRFSIIRKICADRNWDLIYSFHFYTNIYAWYSAIGNKANCFGSIRNDGYFEKRMTGKLSFFHFYLPDLVVGNSKHGILNAQKAFPLRRKLDFLNNVIDLNKFQFMFLNIGLNEQIKLLFVGRFEQQKRPDRAVNFIKHIRDHGVDAHLKMIGRGSLKNSTAQLVHSLGLEEIVDIASETENVQSEYGKAHWLLISSDYEGTPNVVLEAMSCGLPVISHDFEGINELLKNGLGIITRLEGFNEHHVLSDNKLRIGIADNARDLIQKQFSITSQLTNFKTLC